MFPKRIHFITGHIFANRFEDGRVGDHHRRGLIVHHLMGWTTANGDPDNFFGPLFTCNAAKGGSNSAKWCYAPFDKLITEAKETTDHAKRVALYEQAQQMMHEIGRASCRERV